MEPSAGKELLGWSKWIPGVIVERMGPLSNIVQIETGALWRRNADQMDWRKIQQDIVNGNKKLYKCPINSTQNY